ncbi:MerR family transcriptional regulator [Streptomyces sp. NPDC045456]|uniref:MerR family transcriptional regulator n=1 Tax=Streptomyces sp. NPDC045456 TaxID=3155254 RepID=UPI0033EC0F65
MRIGELATKTGVSVRALRYYEEQQLLASERSHSGQRLYQDSAVDRVQLIRQLYAAGLPSKSIRTLLACESGVATPELLTWFSGERDRIDRQIGGLMRSRERLDGLIATATAAVRAGGVCHPS